MCKVLIKSLCWMLLGSQATRQIELCWFVSAGPSLFATLINGKWRLTSRTQIASLSFSKSVTLLPPSLPFPSGPRESHNTCSAKLEKTLEGETSINLCSRESNASFLQFIRHAKGSLKARIFNYLSRSRKRAPSFQEAIQRKSKLTA